MNRPRLLAPRRSARDRLSAAITAVSLCAILVLAIPAGLLLGLIYLIWTASDALTDRLNRNMRGCSE